VDLPEAALAPDEDPVTFAEALHGATPTVWVTPAILVVNVLVFVAMVATGVSPTGPSPIELLKWGADFGPATVAGGEWWRVVTAAFVHVGVLHLAFNMYAFWGAGAMAERLYGNVAVLILYLVAVVAGSLVSILWAPEAVSAGASGAVFGVYGALLAFVLRARADFPMAVLDPLRNSVLGFIAYNLFFGLTMPHISNSAHLGGLVTGLAAGGLLGRDLRAPAEAGVGRYLRAAALAPVLAALAWGTHQRVSTLPSVQSRRLWQEAAAAARTSDWAKARQRLDEAIRNDPSNPRLYTMRGYVRERAEDRDGAIADYGEAIARDPKAAGPLSLRCLTWLRKNALDRAAADCDAALKLDPKDADAWHGRASILHTKGLYEEAIRAADRLIEASPDNAHSLLLRADIFRHKGDLAAAEGDVRKALALAPNDPHALMSLAHLLVRRGDFEAARKECDRAVSLAPEDAGNYSQRASVLRALGDLEHALADNDRAVELDGKNAMWHNNRAWTLLHLGRLQEGLAAVERSLALNPDSAHAVGTRCWIRATLGNRKAAEDDCKRALDLLPADTASVLDRGMLHFLRGRYADAVAEWQRGKEESPDDALLLRGWIAKAEALGRQARAAR